MNTTFRSTEENDLASVESKDTLIRVIDWRIVIPIVAAIVGWAFIQWGNYNGLINQVAEQNKLITLLTTKIENISEQLSSTKEKNMTQDFEITRLKDQVTTITAWKDAQIEKKR